MMSTAPVSAPPCAANAELFQHPLLEDTSTPSDAEARRTQQSLIREAEAVCAQCPMLANCLFSAIVEHDVAGYAAATTQRQRAEIRSLLGVKVKPEDFDTLAGVTTPNRQINHDEVVRLRNANPYESLDSIARRLGCSLSTVKRHLRKARTDDEPIEAPALHSVAPSMEQVVHAFRVVRRAARAERKAA